MKLSTSTEWLFFHLWKKSPHSHQSCPGVFVADTIIYRWAQPYFWYFTNKDGQIGRKTKEKVFVENIEQIFNDNSDPSSGITTCYMKSSENQKKNIQQDRIEFEYFDKPQFHNFLYQREKCLNALLQKFIKPKNGRNSMIKIKWTPQFCILYQKTNIHKMNNNKIALNDRLITFEGAENLTNSESITSPILATDLEYICLNIVKHIQEVSGGNIQISQMVLYFKVDQTNKLWLLFCSGIKIREKYQISEQSNQSTHKTHNRLQSPILTIHNPPPKASTNQFQIPLGNNICIDCSKVDKMYSLQYTHIIASFEGGLANNDPIQMQIDFQADPKKHQDLTDRMGFPLDFLENEEDAPSSMNQPYLLTKVNGKISDKKYQLLRQNPSWLQQVLQVCSDCYLKYTQVTLLNDESRTMNKIVKDYHQQVTHKVAQNRNQLQSRTTLTAIKDKINQLQDKHNHFNPINKDNNSSINTNTSKFKHVRSKFMDDINSRQSIATSKFYQEYQQSQQQSKPKTSQSNHRPSYKFNELEELQEEQSIQPIVPNRNRQIQSSQQQSRQPLQKRPYPDAIYNTQSNKQLALKAGLPKINNQSICSNSTNASSKRIDHSSQIGIIQELKSHLKDL